MTKYLNRSLQSFQTPRKLHIHPQRGQQSAARSNKSRKIYRCKYTPSKSTAHHTTASKSESTGLRPVYKSPEEAKEFSLVLIQDLVKNYNYDAHAYCLML